MLPELSILKFILEKCNYEKISRYINIEDIPKELKGIYRVIENHYKENEGSLSIDDVANLFFSTHPPDREYFLGVFDNLRVVEASEHSVEVLAKALKRAQVLRKLAETAYDASEGKETALKAVKSLTEELSKLDTEQTTADWEFVTDDIEELLKSTVETTGLRWRLNSLNKHLGSLRKGDFGFVFARPETGKTTFLASEISHMAEQLKQMNSGPVLHINNEEQNDKVKLRYSQATLGATLEQLLGNKAKANESIKERIGGYILIPNQGTYSRRDVEQLCERTNPGLLIFDQIDKIGGFDGERDDLRLGSIYQWARDLAKQYCPTIGICQADGSGENTRWLTMGNVANAKTSKQAEADWILGIGKIHDGGYENVRFFHLSKNKLIGDADTRGERHGKWETVIDPSIARYRDIK